MHVCRSIYVCIVHAEGNCEQAQCAHAGFNSTYDINIVLMVVHFSALMFSRINGLVKSTVLFISPIERRCKSWGVWAK